MDAESYSLHTFEALLSQSMENLGKQTKTSVPPISFLQVTVLPSFDDSFPVTYAPNLTSLQNSPKVYPG